MIYTSTRSRSIAAATQANEDRTTMRLNMSEEFASDDEVTLAEAEDEEFTDFLSVVRHTKELAYTDVNDYSQRELAKSPALNVLFLDRLTVTSSLSQHPNEGIT